MALISAQLFIYGVLRWQRPLEVLPIFPRNSWSAAEPDVGTMEGMGSIARVTYHHSADTTDGAAEIRRIQIDHMSKPPPEGPYSDIGYHFVMTKNGEVYAGRAIEGLNLPGGYFTKGSHVEVNNTLAGLGICVLGNYDNPFGDDFSAARQQNLEKNITALCRRYGLVAGLTSYHQAMALPGHFTVCPGIRAFSQINSIKLNVFNNLK